MDPIVRTTRRGIRCFTMTSQRRKLVHHSAPRRYEKESRLKREFGPGRRERGFRQIFIRIHRRVAHAHFIMEVGRRYAAGISDCANRLAAANLLSRQDIESREVGVVGLKTVAVIDDDEPPVAREASGKLYHAIPGRMRGSS